MGTTRLRTAIPLTCGPRNHGTGNSPRTTDTPPLATPSQPRPAPDRASAAVRNPASRSSPTSQSASLNIATATSPYAIAPIPADHGVILLRTAGTAATPMATATSTSPSPALLYGTANAASNPTAADTGSTHLGASGRSSGWGKIGGASYPPGPRGAEGPR